MATAAGVEALVSLQLHHPAGWTKKKNTTHYHVEVQVDTKQNNIKKDKSCSVFLFVFCFFYRVYV